MATSTQRDLRYQQWIEREWWELSGIQHEAIGLVLGTEPVKANLPGEPDSYGIVVNEDAVAGFLGVVECSRKKGEWNVPEDHNDLNIGRVLYVRALEFVDWAVARGYPVPEALLAGVRLHNTPASPGSDTPSSTVRDEKDCREWLMQQMRAGLQHGNKNYYFQIAKKKFNNLPQRAFNRAWADAVTETGAITWREPGRRRKKS